MLRDANSKLGDAKKGIFQLNHEDTDKFEKAFRLETSEVIEVFKSIGNTFLDTKSSLTHITAKHMLDDTVSKSTILS